MPIITYQPDEASANDTHINSTSSTTNFSTTTTLQVGERNDLASDQSRTLIKFDISLIPRNARILRADLTLTIDAVYTSNARDQKLYRLLRNWVESQATWGEWSSGNSWTTAGGAAGTDYDSTVWATLAISAAETPGTAKTWSLSTTELTKMVSGVYPNYGWILMVDGTALNDGILYRSASHATTSTRPKLEVEYAIGGSSPMISPFGKF